MLELKLEKEKIRILVASDIHGDVALVYKLAKKAKDYDVDLVILAGDLTFAEKSLNSLIGPFKKVGKTVLLLPGNHETIATVDFLANLYSPGTYNFHAYSIMLGNIGIAGVGLANIGLFSVSDKEIEKVAKKVLSEIKNAKSKILITHVPPFGTKVDNLGFTYGGSIGLRKIIEEYKPNLVLCGHIHETFGKKDKIGDTLIINVGREGKIFELNVKTGEVKEIA